MNDDHDRTTPGPDDQDRADQGGAASDQTPTSAGATDAAAGAGPRLVPWTHRPTTGEGATGPAAASSGTAATGADTGAHTGAVPTDDVDDDDEPGRRGMRPAAVVAVVGGAAVVAVVLGTVLAFSGGGPLAAGAPAATSEPATTTSTSARAASTASATPSTTPSPTPSEAPSQRPATPPPAEAAEEAPYVTPIAAGTVVAEDDVRSPKGSISFHYRVVATGNGDFTTDVSGFTSTLPVSVQASFFEIAPSVGDGLTSSGGGPMLLGGPTSSPVSVSTPLPIGQPSYLRSLVVSTAEAPVDAPVEIGTGKVLAVADVPWAVPARATNIAPVDSGATSFAGGEVTATTASGAPKRYQVASGDLTDVVAQRFGISVSALIYLNQGLEVLDAEQHLLEGTTLLLDPDSL